MHEKFWDYLSRQPEQVRKQKVESFKDFIKQFNPPAYFELLFQEKKYKDGSLSARVNSILEAFRIQLDQSVQALNSSEDISAISRIFDSLFEQAYSLPKSNLKDNSWRELYLYLDKLVAFYLVCYLSYRVTNLMAVLNPNKPVEYESLKTQLDQLNQYLDGVLCQYVNILGLNGVSELVLSDTDFTPKAHIVFKSPDPKFIQQDLNSFFGGVSELFPATLQEKLVLVVLATQTIKKESREVLTKLLTRRLDGESIDQLRQEFLQIVTTHDLDTQTVICSMMASFGKNQHPRYLFSFLFYIDLAINTADQQVIKSFFDQNKVLKEMFLAVQQPIFDPDVAASYGLDQSKLDSYSQLHQRLNVEKQQKLELQKTQAIEDAREQLHKLIQELEDQIPSLSGQVLQIIVNRQDQSLENQEYANEVITAVTEFFSGSDQILSSFAPAQQAVEDAITQLHSFSLITPQLVLEKTIKVVNLDQVVDSLRAGQYFGVYQEYLKSIGDKTKEAQQVLDKFKQDIGRDLLSMIKSLNKIDTIVKHLRVLGVTDYQVEITSSEKTQDPLLKVLKKMQFGKSITSNFISKILPLPHQLGINSIDTLYTLTERMKKVSDLANIPAEYKQAFGDRLEMYVTELLDNPSNNFYWQTVQLIDQLTPEHIRVPHRRRIGLADQVQKTEFSSAAVLGLSVSLQELAQAVFDWFNDIPLASLDGIKKKLSPLAIQNCLAALSTETPDRVGYYSVRDGSIELVFQKEYSGIIIGLKNPPQDFGSDQVFWLNILIDYNTLQPKVLEVQSIPFQDYTYLKLIHQKAGNTITSLSKLIASRVFAK